MAHKVLFKFVPGMRKSIQDMCDACGTCAQYGTTSPKEPMRSVPIPTRPWQIVSQDICELQNQSYMYLLTVCHFSDWIKGCALRADLHDTILSHATSSRQAYDMTYDCRSVLKHVLKCYDIFSDVHNNSKSCRALVVSRCCMRQSCTV